MKTYLIPTSRGLVPLDEAFLEWHKHSSWDGDNETKEIKHGIITYRFFNHYWD